MIVTTGFKPYPGLSPSLAHYLGTWLRASGNDPTSNPALLAGDSKVYILNIRPQIDLSRLVSIFNSADRKNLRLTVRVQAITRCDVILRTPDNPP